MKKHICKGKGKSSRLQEKKGKEKHIKGRLWTRTIKNGLEDRPRYKLAIAYQYIST